MKTVKFRPLRRIKKTGKIAVAPYMQWRKVKTADYDVFGSFRLHIFRDHENMLSHEPVYNHKGEQLFWFNHQNQEALPKNYVNIFEAAERFGIPREHFEGEEWKVSEPIGEGFDPYVMGFDCDGVPVFSHNTAKYAATHYDNMDQFEPLTVGLVLKWYGWFLWTLKNAQLVQ